jgi:uncharacterized BrkB/YihY/UPF0761 family membrane protein
VGSKQHMSTLVVVIAIVVSGAIVLSVTQAWAAGPSQHGTFRYVLAVVVSTTTLTLAMLFLIGFRGEVPPAHQNVAWSALGLATVTTVVVFEVGNLRRTTSHSRTARCGSVRGRACHRMFVWLPHLAAWTCGEAITLDFR